MYIKKVFLWAALGLTATATLTSCEDILGHWEKPTPAVPASAVEDARVLGAALEAGATVSVNYTVGSTSYVATFQKNADDTYTLLSNTAAAAGARATTRMIADPYPVPTGDAAAVGDNIKLALVGDKLVFTVMSTAGAPIFKAEMNVDGGEVTVVNTNGGGQDCTIGQVSVGDQAKAIVNPVMKAVNISNNNETVEYAVKYSEGDKWADVVKRYEGVEVVEITTSEDGFVSVKFSKDFIVATLKAAGATPQQAAGTYEESYSGTFYLTTANYESGSRAGTRGSEPTFIKATDPVVGTATYKLTPAPVTIDLSELTDGYQAKNGATLTGTLTSNVQISIAAGATVTLKDANINGDGTWNSGNYAGISCDGDATIILEGTNNKVKGFANGYPCISVPSGNTLTIQGTGSLTAISNGKGAGIGGGYNVNCGNIVINGGTITATGGESAAGIGSGFDASCGNITITGGTVTADGGKYAAGIGSGFDASCGNIEISGGNIVARGGDLAAGIGGGDGGSCGDITITSDVTSVTATKGSSATYSIGARRDCGTITIGGTPTRGIDDSPYYYPPRN